MKKERALFFLLLANCQAGRSRLIANVSEVGAVALRTKKAKNKKQISSIIQKLGREKKTEKQQKSMMISLPSSEPRTDDSDCSELDDFALRG